MPDIPTLQRRLLAWFEANRQDLPWRASRDPYRVWVAEIMLQQTQIATVIPYFERFMARFPTLGALADAPDDDVLKVWEGLGYYSRARNLRRAAQKIVHERGGEFPQTAKEWKAMPGVGRYTAGAIASLAFGEDTAALDGNMIRVLARWFGVDGDITRGETQRELWRIAESLIPAGRAGAWNEAVMELGQRICLPKTPACERCPAAKQCEAYKTGNQASLPARTPRKALPHHEVAAGIIHREDGRVLIAKRHPYAMLGGLWEFPGGKREPGETLADCLAREIQEELAIEVAVGEPFAVVKHAYTHFRITLHAFHCRYLGGEPQAIGCADWTWAAIGDLDQFAFPRTNHKIIAALKASEGGAG